MSSLIQLLVGGKRGGIAVWKPGVIGFIVITTVIGSMLIMASCQSPGTFDFPMVPAEAGLRGFPVVGTWSEPIGGLRCRVLATSSEAVKLGDICVAFEVENVGSTAVKFTREGCPPFWDVFRLDGQPIILDRICATFYAGRVRLKPGEGTVLATGSLKRVPPALANDGHLEVKLSAEIDMGGKALTAPPIQLRVKTPM